MFYDRYVQLAAKKGVSVSKAAEEVGLNRTAIQKWKKGGVPRGAVIERMAEYFEVSADYLLTGEESQQKKPSAEAEERSDYIYVGGLSDKDKDEIRMLVEFKRKR